MSSSNEQYWLARWVDEYEVANADEAARLLKLPGPMARLPELAAESPTYLGVSRKIPDLSVTAGRGIDLSGYLSCSAFKCMRDMVNESYAKILHYFDYLIVQGESPRNFLDRLSETPASRHDELHRDLLDQISILLYLKEIGADRYIIFRDKPRAFCRHCLAKAAKTFGMSSYLDANVCKETVARLAGEAKFKLHWDRRMWYFWLYHDFFDGPAMGKIGGKKKEQPSPLQMASEIVSDYSGATIADVIFANRIGAPLAQVIEISWVPDATTERTTLENDVALKLQLPVMNGLPIRDLLKLREDERPFFEQFRLGIREAIRDQLSRRESGSPSEIASSVVQEYVVPALADIDRRLKVNKRRLTKNAAASITVGTSAISAGLLGSLPLVIAAGAAAVAAALPHVYKYIDSSSEIELSDMYFLWKVNQLSRPSH